MGRRKKSSGGDGGGGSPAWMATFSDLMNLLLCFFVLLFSMSSVDAEKYAQVVASLSNTFSMFDGGGSSVGEGQLISSGVSQLHQLENYTYNTGQPTEDVVDEDNFDPEEYLEEINKELAEELYEEVTQMTETEGIEDVVEVAIDSKYQYVKIYLSGAVLFDSAKADVKEESKIVLDKIGNILKNYEDHLIKIEGHTDNVPLVNSALYEDNMQLSSARAYSVWWYMTEEKSMDPTTLEASGRSEYEPIADNDSEAGRAKNRRVEFKIYNDILKK